MLNFKPYVITLENRQDRLESIKTFYNNFLNDITIFYGADKETVRKNKSKITTKWCNNLCTIPIVGCASSHILLWKEIASKNEDDFFLVIEDDTFIKLDKLNELFIEIDYIFKRNKMLFLQIVGEGFILKETEIVNNNTEFENYKYHFFLGAYMIKPSVAAILFNHFLDKKINYHIDFSLNKVFKENNIKPLILKKPNIGEQQGLIDSNMSSSSSKCFNEDRFKRLYYALNLPICSIFNCIITFSVIFLIICFILACITKNFFVFVILAILYFELVKYDY